MVDTKVEKKKLQPIDTDRVNILDQVPTTATPNILDPTYRDLSSHSPDTSERQIIHRKNIELTGATTEVLQIHFELQNHHDDLSSQNNQDQSDNSYGQQHQLPIAENLKIYPSAAGAYSDEEI